MLAQFTERLLHPSRTVSPWIIALTFIIAEVILAVGMALVSISFLGNSRFLINTPIGMFWTQALNGAVMLAITYVFIKSKKLWKRELCLDRFQAKIALGAVVMSMLVLGLVLTVSNRFGLPENSVISVFMQPGQNTALLYIILTLAVSVVEEIVMRGLLFKRFRGRYGLLASTAIMALISCITHLAAIHDASGILMVVALNVVFCVTLEIGNDLWSCIAAHGVFNLLGYLVAH